jgi:hypothetical protein
MDQQTRTELEAATFRAFINHLQQRTDVQNIDLMNLAGFCRNCLWKWYQAAAEERGVTLPREEAQQAIYGMTYGEWKQRYQTDATPEQLARFEETRPLHSEISGHR